MAKNNHTKKQIDVELEHGGIGAWSRINLTEECKVYRYKIGKIDLIINHNYVHPNTRSSHLDVFREKGVLKNFANFT